MTAGLTPRRARAAPALVLLAALLFAAGLSRLGLGVAAVVAQEPDTPTAEGGATAPDDPGDLFAALREREARLDARADTLEARAQDLQAAEKRLAARLDELRAAEEELSQTLARTETAAEDDLARLTTVFQNMDPAQAAALFATMDTEFAAGFIARLRPDFAGAVMAGLEPNVAYGISAVLAGRNADAPRAPQ